ncbi:MAG: ABC transporter ATP-binding protein [Chitinophagaceae bacterium]|nr:ABC transporter ATP-binding protein [Chitinophagaceae bacterium]
MQIKELKKQYHGAIEPALDGLSFDVSEGSIVGLLGPNGAGKTTSINIMCGLVAPDTGTASIYGVSCIDHPASVREQIGVVPQQIALFPNMTAMENFMYIGRLYGLEDRFIKERASDLLERLGLMKHADKRVNRYSGGMKRRANIIASLLHDPLILILDEPTAGVDVQSRAMILDFLREYNNKGKTILYTSHLLEEAEKICDEVVIIDSGKLITSGSPKTLFENTIDCRHLEDVFLHYTGHSVRD